MTDLRFGIPWQSPDDFVHPSHRLRIAGLFIDTDGMPIGLVRRKGRGSTLARFDVVTMELAPNLPVMGEHELALGGGLERCEFETLFGLNHARLRAGGNLLLKKAISQLRRRASRQGVSSVRSWTPCPRMPSAWPWTATCWRRAASASDWMDTASGPRP